MPRTAAPPEFWPKKGPHINVSPLCFYPVANPVRLNRPMPKIGGFIQFESRRKDRFCQLCAVCRFVQIIAHLIINNPVNYPFNLLRLEDFFAEKNGSTCLNPKAIKIDQMPSQNHSLTSGFSQLMIDQQVTVSVLQKQCSMPTTPAGLVVKDEDLGAGLQVVAAISP